MDRSTFSTWGSLICVVLVVAIMMAFATPFGKFVTQGVQSVMSDFKVTADEALNASDILGGNGGDETPDNPSNPETPDEPTVVNFTIDGVSYSVDPGTTWWDWVDGPNGNSYCYYAEHEYDIDENGEYIYTMICHWEYTEAVNGVNPYDEIVPGDYICYNDDIITFSIEGVSYTAYDWDTLGYIVYNYDIGLEVDDNGEIKNSTTGAYLVDSNGNRLQEHDSIENGDVYTFEAIAATVTFTVCKTYMDGSTEEYTVPEGTTWRQAIEMGIFDDGAFLEEVDNELCNVFVYPDGAPIQVSSADEAIKAKTYECY